MYLTESASLSLSHTHREMTPALVCIVMKELILSQRSALSFSFSLTLYLSFSLTLFLSSGFPSDLCSVNQQVRNCPFRVGAELPCQDLQPSLSLSLLSLSLSLSSFLSFPHSTSYFSNSLHKFNSLSLFLSPGRVHEHRHTRHPILRLPLWVSVRP